MASVAFLDTPSLDWPEVQTVLVRLCGWLRLNPNPQGVIDAFGRAYPGSFQSRIIPFTAANTLTVWIKWENSNLILSGGTIGLAHIPIMIAGWAAPMPNPAYLGASLAFGGAAQALFNAVDPTWVGDGMSWILAGHSFGGSQLAAFASRLRISRPTSRITGFSYGSPRPGNIDLQTRSPTFNFVRWFNDTDPVPMVPPHTDEAPILALALPNDVQLGCNRQVQIESGRMIRADGTWVAQELPTLPLNILEPSLTSWIAGSDVFGAQSHMAIEYERRFGLMPTPSLSNPTSPPRPRLTDDQPYQATVQQRDRLINQAVANLGGAPFPATMQYAPADPTKRYTVRKQGGHWVVLYAGDVFAIGPGKRAAKRIARAGNRAARANPASVPAIAPSTLFL